MSKTQEQEEQESVLKKLTRIDKSISLKLHKLTTPLIPTFLLKLLEISGDGRLWFPITISLLLSPFSLNSHQLHSLLLSLLVGLIADIAVIGLLKHLVRRPRPSHNSHPMGPTLPVDHWSFPSGHASRTCFIAAFFDRFLSRNPDILSNWIGGWEMEEEVVVWYLICGVWVWGLITSISRVFLGRHYVFDVFVGSLIGVLNAFFVFRFVSF